MKKKLRRLLKDFYQIGNYIYADLQGRVKLVVPRGERVTFEKIQNDYAVLVSRYGIEAANTYLISCCNYLK